MGGKSIPLSDLDLVHRSGGTEQQHDLDDSGDRASADLDADDRFEAGESVTVSHSFTGTVWILLADTSTNGHVLYDKSRTVTTPTPTPVPSPTLAGHQLQDTTENNVVNYELIYDIDNTANFDHVQVTCDSTDTSWAYGTRSSSNTDDTLQYTEGGVEGDTYESTVRVIDTDGIVVDETVITDVADGTDP